MVNIEGVWRSMISRCEIASHDNSFSAYVGCSVCDQWKDYEAFKNWYLDNIYNCNGERLEVDKDLLVKGNKIYSPNTCCLLPKRINVVLSSRRAYKNGLPPGVTWPGTRSDSFIVHIGFNGQNSSKTFKNKNDAFVYYKTEKEAYIKELAAQYKNILPAYVFNALIRYEVLITDSNCNTCGILNENSSKPRYSSFLEYMREKCNTCNT